LLGIGLTWEWRNEKNLHAFCNEIKQGTLLSLLPKLAEKHHLDSRKLVNLRIQNEEIETSSIYLPVKGTIGVSTCRINFNRTMVLSSKFDID
jgi:hypothetical protein